MRLTDEEMNLIEANIKPFAELLKENGYHHLIIEALYRSKNIEENIIAYLENLRYDDFANDIVYFPISANQYLPDDQHGNSDSLVCHIDYSPLTKFRLESIDYYRMSANREFTSVSYHMIDKVCIPLNEIQKLVEKADHQRKENHLKEYHLDIHQNKSRKNLSLKNSSSYDNSSPKNKVMEEKQLEIIINNVAFRVDSKRGRLIEVGNPQNQIKRQDLKDEGSWYRTNYDKQSKNIHKGWLASGVTNPNIILMRIPKMLFYASLVSNESLIAEFRMECQRLDRGFEVIGSKPSILLQKINKKSAPEKRRRNTLK